MIRPISQQQIQNINNPNAQAFAGLNQTLQHVGQVNRQSRLDKLQETAFNSQQKAASVEALKNNAPVVHAGLTEIGKLATKEERFKAAQSLFKDVPGISDLIDDPEDFTDESLSRNLNFTGQLIAKGKQGRVLEGIGDNGEAGFFTRNGNTLERIQGATPREKKPLVNIGGQEKEEDKAFGKFLVKNFDDINTRATASTDNIQQLKLAKNIDVSTGKLEPLKAWGGAVIQGLGLDPNSFGLNNAANAESFNAIMGNVLATKLAAQKGPQTDRDADRMMKTLAGLGNTPEAKEFMLNSSIAIEERQVEQRDFHAAWKQNTGSFTGADKAWKSYINKTPIFGKNPNSGRPVFFNEFKSAMVEANDNISDDQILKLWRTKYRGR